MDKPTKAEVREIKKRPRMQMHGRSLRNVLTLWQKDSTTRQKKKKNK